MTSHTIPCRAGVVLLAVPVAMLTFLGVALSWPAGCAASCDGELEGSPLRTVVYVAILATTVIGVAVALVGNPKVGALIVGWATIVAATTLLI